MEIEPSKRAPRDKARDAVQTGDPTQITAFLRQGPLTNNVQYGKMLQDVEDIHSAKSLDEKDCLWSSILDDLRRRSGPKQQKLRNPDTEDDSDDNDVSMTEVFKQCMRKAPKGPANEATLDAVWRLQKDHLLKDTLIAMHCVDVRHPNMLKLVLDELEKRRSEIRDKTIHACLRAQKGSKLSALQLAIERLDMDSIRYLSLFKTGKRFDKVLETPSECPLQAAIQLIGKEREKVETAHQIIDLILENGPKALYSCDPNTGYSPYQLARRREKKEKSELRREFQKAASTLKQAIFSKLKWNVDHIAKALYGLEDKEFYLDLSDFNQESHSFKDFVDDIKNRAVSMQQQQGQEANVHRRVKEDFGLQFEDTLLYLCLPDLRRFTDQTIHSAVSEFLDWLYQQGVRSILNLSITDNVLQPLNDDEMLASLLNRFEIRILDWRKLDLNLDILLKVEEPHGTALRLPRETLQELRLYSSGNWSVLHHWASEEGLAKLFDLSVGPLRKVKIQFVEPRHLTATHRTSFLERLEVYKKRFREQASKHIEKIDFDIVNVYGWDEFAFLKAGQATPEKRLRIFDYFKNCHGFLHRLKTIEEDLEGSSRISQISKIAETLAIRMRDPVKIAIIDNGTDKFRSTLYDNIAQGVSFKDFSDKRLSWWMVSDPHGTQMSSLIQRINPYCRLYIARVGRERNDITDQAAIAAINWAVRREVDIISLSWTSGSTSFELQKAIESAGKDRLVFCASDDKAERDDTITKNIRNSIIRVAAADSDHRARKKSDKTVDFMIDGEDIDADGPRYMASHFKQSISGSSVATALASGIASLILCLARIANKPDYAPEFRNRDICLKVFGAMVHDDDQDRVIDPALLFEKVSFAFDRESQQMPPALEGFQLQRYQDRKVVRRDSSSAESSENDSHRTPAE